MVAPLAGQAAFAQSEPVPPDSWARRQEIAQLGEITPNVAADVPLASPGPGGVASAPAQPCDRTQRTGRTTLWWSASVETPPSSSAQRQRTEEAAKPATSVPRGKGGPRCHPAGIIEFQHWFASLPVTSSDTSNDDEARVDWVRDGVTVSGWGATLPRARAATVWRQRRLIAPSGGETHQVRFHFIDLPPHDTAVEGGVDDLRVYQVVSCTECCDADVNRDGNVDQDDVLYLTNVIGGGDNPNCIDPDFNHDGNVDQVDIADLINYVGGAGCP